MTEAWKRLATPWIRGATALALLLLSGCQDPPRPNVILISIDTLRADHLACYGYSRPTSPFIDSMAHQGVLFESAFAQSSWTLPSHMSLLTSRYPHSHRVHDEGSRLPPDVATLALLLQENGYETVGLVSWFLVAGPFGFDRGFDHYEELIPPPEQWDSSTQHSIKADEFVERVTGSPALDLDRPFFLFLHLFDPHINYEPPLEHAQIFDPSLDDPGHGTYDSLKRFIKGLSTSAERIPEDELRRVTALYDGEIHFADAFLQRLFEVLGQRSLLQDTLVVFTSDHGEELDDHGSMEGHQWTLFDEVIHVPLIMVFPDREHANTAVQEVVQLIDVAPTILSYVGIDPPSGLEGEDLLPLMSNGSGSRGGAAFAQHIRGNSKLAIRTPRYKLIFTEDTGVNSFGVPVEAGFELFDLEQDPLEQRNIFDPESEVAQSLMRRLAAWYSHQPHEVDRPPLVEISPEDLERLRALGYHVEGG